MSLPDNSSLVAYDHAIIALAKTPDSLDLKHQAVLALVRAGSLEFALTQYERYGLDEIQAHSDPKALEDIMALAGRLQKDLYLASSGRKAQQHAEQSAQKYEAAFKASGGYYSGINSTTMALLAGMSEDMVAGRANAILQLLPAPENLSKETLYFIEATRAEAHMLLGASGEAQVALRRAFDHDPVNFSAHASTLKQFRMIVKSSGKNGDWLSLFTPPKTAHYVGHMFKINGTAKAGILSETQIAQLKIRISDAIQKNDIGFGYGALAAGADILIAETLLEEGAELHVVLPVDTDLFIKHSVAPYGADWVERFTNCLNSAHSVQIASHSTKWPDPEIDGFSRRIAMGQAIMQCKQFSSRAIQMLIWDEMRGKTGTAMGAAKWVESGRSQIILSYPGKRPTRKDDISRVNNLSVRANVFRADKKQLKQYSSIHEAANAALVLQKTENSSTQIGIHIEVGSDPTISSDISRYLAEKAVPSGILISETAASFLLLNHQDEFVTDYMGHVDTGSSRVRAFALKRNGEIPLT